MKSSLGMLPSGNLQLGFPGSSDGKESACKAGDLGFFTGSGRSPGVGNGNPLYRSCLESSMNRGAWRATFHGVTKSRTRLSAPGWCTGKTQRDGVGREVGGGIGMGNTCKSMADSCQCMAKTTTIL